MDTLKEEIQASRFFGAFGKVYTLADQEGNIFYVGCTTYPLEQRIRSHIGEAHRSKKSNLRRLAKIRELNYDVVCAVVEMKWVTGRTSKEAQGKLAKIEKQYIKKYIELGYDLCNVKSVDPTPETNKIKEHVGMTFRVINNKIIISNKPE